MAALDSELKHYLVNVNYSNDIPLNTPIKVKCDNTQGETELKLIKYYKSSWCIFDTENNVYTISTLNSYIQYQIMMSVRSQLDSRYAPFNQLGFHHINDKFLSEHNNLK